MIDATTDWIIIIVVALVIFGGSKKIPELARSIGRATGEYKKGQLEIENELKGGTASTMKVDGQTVKPEGQIDYMKIAQDLNIDINNKTIDQIIKEINEKLGKV
jgi:sec-independent protein translocase protein TatA